MKKILFLAATILLFTTTYAIAEWIKPLRKACTKNGGKLTPEGSCKANWLDANRICRAAGGELPTIDELKKVVMLCDGEIDDYENNSNDLSYQQCYKQKGFSISGNYWSSTTTTYDIYGAWSIDFKYGSQDDSYKNCYNDVRCVKVRDVDTTQGL